MTEPKKYLLFAGDDYYPSGGMVDYIGSFDTIAEAAAKGRERETLSNGFVCSAPDWYQIVEHATMREVTDEGEYV